MRIEQLNRKYKVNINIAKAIMISAADLFSITVK